MVPIAITSDKQFDEEGFRNYLTDLCRKHKKEKRALAFAFLVYDFEDNTIQQILENPKYWTALDKISGRFLSVFYINSQDNYYKKRQKQIFTEEKRQQQSVSQKGYMQFLTPITLKATPLEKSIYFLKKEFGLDDNLKHPFILFFQTDGEELLDYFVVALQQEKLEEAFLELKSQIKTAVDSVSKVTPDNFKNHKEIFNLIKLRVEGENSRNFIKTKVISKIGIGSIISFVKFLTGS